MVYHVSSFLNRFCYSASAISTAANIQIPQELIDALLVASVFHFNVNEAREIDSICNAHAMQCLTGYAISPSFHDLAYTMAMRIAYHEINQLQFAINSSMDTAQKFKLKFYVNRTPEATRIKELGEHIQKLEEATQKKSSSRVEKSSSSTPEQANIEQRTSPAEEDNEGLEPDATPLLRKRKISVPVRRVIMLPSSHRRQQSSEATKENQPGSSTPASVS